VADVIVGVILREEHRLRVFESSVLMETFGVQEGRGIRGQEDMA
jgi:hypothetical protein